MEGFGPHSGTPVDFGCIVAGKNPVTIDATVCRMVGLDVDRVDYFRAAEARGLGSADESGIEIRGSSIEEVYKPLYLPYMEGFDRWPEYGFHIENACSTCQGLLAYTMTKLEALEEYEANEGLQIICGRKKKLPEELLERDDLILMGDCIKGLKKKIEKAGGSYLSIPGCPPVETFPYWTIVDREQQPGPGLLENPPSGRQRHEEESEKLEEWLRKGGNR
jgi:hypothetical protein